VSVVFVDAYNVINSWPNLRNIKEYSYEAARQKLIEILQNYSTFKGYKVVIVFDAHKVNGNLEKKDKLGNIVVVFTKEGETADNYIEKAVDKIGRKIEVVVVTSDSLEQQIAFQRGAVRMSSIEFYFEVEEIDQRIKKRTQKNLSEHRNLLEDRIEKSVFEKLDKIRRSR
jgi:uncharacterized protein